MLTFLGEERAILEEQNSTVKWILPYLKVSRRTRTKTIGGQQNTTPTDTTRSKHHKPARVYLFASGAASLQTGPPGATYSTRPWLISQSATKIYGANQLAIFLSNIRELKTRRQGLTPAVSSGSYAPGSATPSGNSVLPPSVTRIWVQLG